MGGRRAGQQDRPDRPVGVVGTGGLTLALAARLRALGWPVLVHPRPAADRPAADRPAAGRPAADGPGEAADLADLAARASCVLTSLPSVADLETLVAGSDGLVRHAVPGMVVVETSTLPLGARERARAQLADFGVTLLDCPAAGTAEQARRGELAVYASGDPEALARGRPVLEAVGRLVWDGGPFGTGTSMKLVADLLAAVQGAALAEALALARRAGLEPRRALDALRARPAEDQVPQAHGAAMVAGVYRPATTPTRVFCQNLGIVAEQAARLGCPTPLLAAAGELYRSALAQGRGDDDVAAVAEVLRGMAGLT